MKLVIVIEVEAPDDMEQWRFGDIAGHLHRECRYAIAEPTSVTVAQVGSFIGNGERPSGQWLSDADASEVARKIDDMGPLATRRSES